mmetsp:Transcript_34379/g.83189  ORF Transcript_34379/g.83189 Transcript_34379/m.83189 type:complete len:491 (-) Transcript_34379:239-1711(-)
MIYGYARSEKTNEWLHERVTPFLKKQEPEHEEDIKGFLKLCVYRRGQYASAETMKTLMDEARKFEKASLSLAKVSKANRLFYFAIPPSVYADVAGAIKASGIATDGWTRMIIEKPFGHDLESAQELSQKLSKNFTEDFIYRIDHYLGKEMVQNMLVLRFGNVFFEPLWNNKYIDCVYMSFKEPFGTEGRGGYFDSSGIIRDVMQNHLLQVLSLFAMEPPVSIDDGASVRNEKVKLLKSVEPIKLEDVVVGQYVGTKDGKKPGYKDDDTLKNKDSITPTFCSMILRICNQRWDGVPFIMRAGKALNQRKAEIRVQFRKVPGARNMFPSEYIPRNELVIRLQPNESVFLRTNVKAPGLTSHPTQNELDLTYKNRYGKVDNPSAYSRLLLEVLRGNQGAFVRKDELLRAWEIFSPLIKELEEKKVQPLPYEYGGRGPPEADQLAIKAGYDEQTLNLRLKAGPRDARKDGRYTTRELDVYVENLQEEVTEEDGN